MARQCSIAAGRNHRSELDVTHAGKTTRLETRTKESNEYASIRVSNSGAREKSIRVGDSNRVAQPVDGDTLAIPTAAYPLGPERW